MFMKAEEGEDRITHNTIKLARTVRTMAVDSPDLLQNTEPIQSDKLTVGDRCFLALTVVFCFLAAWVDARGWKGDAVAYYDLASAIRQHQWHAIFNASWSPLYPAFMLASQVPFRFNPMYAAGAIRLLNAALGVAFFGCSYYMALAVRRNVLRNGVSPARLVSKRLLMVLVTDFAFFFWSQDLTGVRPDALLACFLLLATGSLLDGITTGSWTAFLAGGVAAGCAYWTKSFAFAYIALLILCLMLFHWRQRRVLLQLGMAAVVFLMVAGPYVLRISAEKHRLTIGDAGRVNAAWYVNGAERLNPVADPAFDDTGNAAGKLLHPAELILKSPEIAYYEPGRVFGAMPPWDDFSYWSDGLAPRASLAQSFRSLTAGVKFLLQVVIMRVQVLALFAVLWVFGMRWDWDRLRNPALLALIVTAVLSITSYLLVHFEVRYIVFALVILASIVLLTAGSQASGTEWIKLHRVALVVALLILVGEAQFYTREIRTMPSGDRIAKGLFDTAEYNAGAEIARQFGPKTQVACVGMEACYDDALWAWYGDAVVSAAVTLPHGESKATLTQICDALVEEKQNALRVLRDRQIKLAVGYFGQGSPCSNDWKAMPGAPGYYMIPTS